MLCVMTAFCFIIVSECASKVKVTPLFIYFVERRKVKKNKDNLAFQKIKANHVENNGKGYGVSNAGRTDNIATSYEEVSALCN